MRHPSNWLVHWQISGLQHAVFEGIDLPIQSQLPLNGMDMHDPILPFLRDASAWPPVRGPLYQRLAGALRGAIQRGDLAPGARLPAERLLAEAAGVGRSTVVAAYDVLR